MPQKKVKAGECKKHTETPKTRSILSCEINEKTRRAVIWYTSPNGTLSKENYEVK